MSNSRKLLRVLVVDDHHDGAESLAALLDLLGCQVRVTHSGAEALQAAPSLKPQLVILDIQMPGMDGFETARRLRAQDWAQRSVFATHSGSPDPAIADLSKAAGCDHCLRKPASIDAFQEIIAAARAAAQIC